MKIRDSAQGDEPRSRDLSIDGDRRLRFFNVPFSANHGGLAVHQLLIAVDSVGIDPLGHSRPDSIYSGSRFLFPVDRKGPVIPIDFGEWHGVLVETEVAEPDSPGAIECAITYTSIFSGRSALREHGLMRGL